MAINVSVGANNVSVKTGHEGDAGMPTGSLGEGLGERLSQTIRGVTNRVEETVKAAVAAGSSGGSGTGASVHTTSVNGKTHVVVSRGDKKMERDYDQSVNVAVSGQNPSVVTISDKNGAVIEVTDF